MKTISDIPDWYPERPGSGTAGLSLHLSLQCVNGPVTCPDDLGLCCPQPAAQIPQGLVINIYDKSTL